MSNINDYLLWRGDIPINSNFKFNEVDSMILARFSYLRFDKIKMTKNETIESISKKMKDLDNKEFRYNGDKELITYLGQSIRFKDMKVTDFIEISDKKVEKQFGAITIHISDKELYISFIGTDSTINGWKEDLNMSFMDNVPCQISGKKYTEKIAKKYKDKKIRIGGHSKGGNVAIYSAITAPKELQNRVIKVYNYDGPGFSKNIIKKYGNNRIINKIETYWPQDSIVGRILNHKEKTTVTYSLEKGIYQHDIYSWQIERDNLVKSEKNTETSEDFNKVGDDWLENTTAEQRKIFIDTLFEIFYSTDANTFGEISKSLSTNLTKILKKYKSISEEDKKIMTETFKVLAASYMNIVKEKETNKFDNLKKEYKAKGKKKLKEFDEKHLSKLKKNKSKNK